MADSKKPLRNQALDKYSEAIRGDLSRLNRLKLKAIVVIEIHARDVIEKMYKMSECQIRKLCLYDRSFYLRSILIRHTFVLPTRTYGRNQQITDFIGPCDATASRPGIISLAIWCATVRKRRRVPSRKFVHRYYLEKERYEKYTYVTAQFIFSKNIKSTKICIKKFLFIFLTHNNSLISTPWFFFAVLKIRIIHLWFKLTKLLKFFFFNYESFFPFHKINFVNKKKLDLYIFLLDFTVTCINIVKHNTLNYVTFFLYYLCLYFLHLIERKSGSKLYKFFRLQRCVWFRVAVAVKILLGYRYRQLRCSANKHSFRIWIRISG